MSAPNWQRDEVTAAAPQLVRLQDFFSGTDAVRENVRSYLPPLPKEKDENYRSRATAVAAPGQLTRTVAGSVGRIFAVAPTLEPNGYPAIADEWQDIDGRGTHGDVWLSRAALYAILDGFFVTLVDAPVATSGVVPMPDAPKHRPRWIGYRRRQVLNWRPVVVDSRELLSMLVLAECADVEDGPWALVREERVRVLRRTVDENGVAVITAEVWAERDGVDGKGKHWTMIDAPTAYRGPREIPIAVHAAAKMTAPFVVTPPLLTLCDKAIEYFRGESNIAYYEEKCCFPVPVITGNLLNKSADGSMVLGPTNGVHVETGGSFAFAEMAGTSLSQLRDNQNARKSEMGMLGLSFLVSETRAAETAKAKALDAAAENATLADAARGIEDGANVALAHHVSYWGVAPDRAPTISLNKNLSGDTIDPAMLRVLLDMRAQGELTRAEFREILSRGRVIPAEMALDEAILAAELESALTHTDPTTTTDPATAGTAA